MVRTRARAACLGLLLDAALGEPPEALHPVGVFGQAMNRLEVALYGDDRLAGAVYAILGAGIGVAAGALTDAVAGESTGTALATGLASACRELLGRAEAVAHLLEEGRLEEARRALPALVGRDPSSLDDNEVARAVIESVAENLSDAVVASALWATVAGAKGVLLHRAVNTMDAMVGHRSARYWRFGWVSARLDDFLGWPAARLTAIFVMAVRPGATWQVLLAWWRDAPAHPSPNAGVAEAAFAAALGVSLGGVNRYGDRLELRPRLGEGPPPAAGDVIRAVGLARQVIGALCVALLVVGRLR